MNCTPAGVTFLLLAILLGGGSLWIALLVGTFLYCNYAGLETLPTRETYWVSHVPEVFGTQKGLISESIKAHTCSVKLNPCLLHLDQPTQPKINPTNSQAPWFSLGSLNLLQLTEGQCHPPSYIQSISLPLISMSASESQELWALPNAKYEHKIIDLQKKIIPLAFQPNEWMWVIFMEWLGIQTPHIWQTENSLLLCQGTDVFITNDGCFLHDDVLSWLNGKHPSQICQIPS